VFVRVSDADPEMLRYLSQRGIAPGDRLLVRERQPFGGPLLVSFADGESQYAIGGRLATAMRVVVDRDVADAQAQTRRERVRRERITGRQAERRGGADADADAREQDDSGASDASREVSA